MYGWIWNVLPGRWPAKLAASLLLFAGALALLWYVAFPIVEREAPFNDVTVNGPAEPSPAP